MPTRHGEHDAQGKHVPGAEDEVVGRRLAVVEQDVRAAEIGVGLLPARRLLGQVVRVPGQLLGGDGADRDELS
jgi:hypothetical protein